MKFGIIVRKHKVTKRTEQCNLGCTELAETHQGPGKELASMLKSYRKILFKVSEKLISAHEDVQSYVRKPGSPPSPS